MPLSYTEFKETLLQESSLSRIWKHTQEHDFGAISAARDAEQCGEGRRFTNAENRQRANSLLSKLRATGYQVTKVKGSYIENYNTDSAKEVGEISFIVIDSKDKGMLKKHLIQFGKEFDQDSILFGEKASAGVLVGTNKCPKAFPGYGKEESQGGAIFGKNGEFMSRIRGRPFVFSESLDLHMYGTCRYPSEFRGPSIQSRMHWSEFDDEL